MRVLCLLLICTFAVANAQRSLGRYNIDTSQISVSGISSGGSMATQFHVAYSSRLIGVGTFAGSPYYCAEGSVTFALGRCMSYPGQVDVSRLIDFTNDYASFGRIDPTSNMVNDKVFVFHGQNDRTVDPGLSPLIEDFYTNYISSANIKSDYSLNAGHCQPTLDYGNLCSSTSSPYINDCNYDGAYEAMNWIHGGSLVKPTANTPMQGDFYTFDQTEFFMNGVPHDASMDDIGFVYVPPRCMDSQIACKLHIAFHGCVQGNHAIGDEYARFGGYNEVAELNDFIILYPQAENHVMMNNPNGCWDWWGYTDGNYATKIGMQMDGVIRMMNKIISPSSA